MMEKATWRTFTEAASLLGVCERTIRRRVQSGQYASNRVGGSVLVDIGTEAIPQMAVAEEARSVAEDARRSQALAFVAFERLSASFAETEKRQAEELRGARLRANVLLVAAIVASAVAACALWTSGQVSNRLSDSLVRIEDSEARERLALSTMADVLRVSAAREAMMAGAQSEPVADDCPASP
jgi:hypothetical protein